MDIRVVVGAGSQIKRYHEDSEISDKCSETSQKSEREDFPRIQILSVVSVAYAAANNITLSVYLLCLFVIDSRKG